MANREQVIVAAESIRATTDAQELEPMVEAAKCNLQGLGLEPIGILLADAGPELLIAIGNDRNRLAAGAAPRWRIPVGLSVRERTRRKLTTQRSRQYYKQRRWMTESAFGDIKEDLGIQRFGLDACASERKLIAASHHLRKLYRHIETPRSPGPSGRPSTRRGPRPRRPRWTERGQYRIAHSRC